MSDVAMQRFYDAVEAIEEDLIALDGNPHERFHPDQIEAFIEYALAALQAAPEEGRDFVVAWLRSAAGVVNARTQHSRNNLRYSDEPLPVEDVALYLRGGIVYVMHIHPAERTWQPVNVRHGDNINHFWEPPRVGLAHVMLRDISPELRDEFAAAGWEERAALYLYVGGVPYPED